MCVRVCVDRQEVRATRPVEVVQSGGGGYVDGGRVGRRWCIRAGLD